MQRHALRITPLTLAIVAALGAPACFVTIDESLLDKQSPPPDAQTDTLVDVLVEAGEGGDAAKDGDAAKPDVKLDGDAAPVEATPEADAPIDVPTEPTEDVIDAPAEKAPEAEAAPPEGGEDVEEGGGDEADVVVAETGGDAQDASEEDVSVLDAPVEADASKPDSGLVVCDSNSGCPPIGCKWRLCVAGQCVDQGPLAESIGSFDLAGGEMPSCQQSYGRTCLVAVGSYVVALTNNGLQVFNVRNPMSVKQETLTTNVAANSHYLARSGQRVWTTATTATPNVLTVSWLDLPLDGTSPLPPVHQTNVYLGGAQTTFYAGSNDTLLLQTPKTGLPGFAKYGPGLPTYLDVFQAAGAAETTSVASSGDRVVLHAKNAAAPYHHSFSLQSNVASSLSSNAGTVDISTLTTSDPAEGFYASSRKGSVVWIIGAYSAASWNDIRAFWLAEPGNPTITPVEFKFEEFTVQQSSLPLGPVAFLDETTVATAVTSAALQAVALDVLSRTGPKVVKRIALPTLPLSGLTVAGDNGYAYVSRNSSVYLFAPACNP